MCIRDRSNFIDSLAGLPVIAPADSSTIKLRADRVGFSLPSFQTATQPLEIKPEGKLNQPGIVQCLIDYAEAGRTVYVLLPEIGDAAHIELRVIE